MGHSTVLNSNGSVGQVGWQQGVEVGKTVISFNCEERCCLCVICGFIESRERKIDFNCARLGSSAVLPTHVVANLWARDH